MALFPLDVLRALLLFPQGYRNFYDRYRGDYDRFYGRDYEYNRYRDYYRQYNREVRAPDHGTLVVSHHLGDLSQ